MARRLLQLLLNLCLAVASAAGTIALVEGGFRYLGMQVPFSLYPSQENCVQRSALISPIFRPNCTGSLARLSFRTNAAGLRGQEIRADGSLRILALGDSCTWGWQVAEDESYPARLQQLLDQRWGSGRYQVLNAGVPGTTSYQGLQRLRIEIEQLRPAVVLTGYGFNDANGGGDVETQLAREAQVLPFLRIDDWLVDHSHAYKWLRWRVWYRRKPPAERRVVVDKYRQNLTGIVDVARAHSATAVFIAFNSAPEYDAARTRVANERGVPLIRYRGPLMDEVHPTAAGYKDLAADIIAKLDNLAVGDTPGPLQ